MLCRLSGVAHGAYTRARRQRSLDVYVLDGYRLVGPGSGNNLSVRETAHITLDADENVVVQRDDFTIDCT